MPAVLPRAVSEEVAELIRIWETSPRDEVMAIKRQTAERLKRERALAAGSVTAADLDGSGTVEEALSLARLRKEGATIMDRLMAQRAKKPGEGAVFQAVGRRKAASASVWVTAGTGKFHVINKHKTLVEYFDMRRVYDVLQPLEAVSALGRFDVEAAVEGGGMSGQAGAVRLALARALQQYNPSWRAPLKEAGFLHRDARIVEPKKPGQPKARKKFTFVKR